MALSIKNLHHPLPGTQTKTSVTFGCAYLTSHFAKYSAFQVHWTISFWGHSAPNPQPLLLLRNNDIVIRVKQNCSPRVVLIRHYYISIGNETFSTLGIWWSLWFLESCFTNCLETFQYTLPCPTSLSKYLVFCALYRQVTENQPISWSTIYGLKVCFWCPSISIKALKQW
jgi:hypothetical protein